MKPVNIALLDSGVDIAHPVFKNWNIPQFVFQDGAWIAAEYQPIHGHGTGVASIMVKNATGFNLTSFVLFEKTLSVPPEKYISALEAIINFHERYDIIHMSLGLRYYNEKLEQLCELLKKKGTIVISALDNTGSISYPAAFSTAIGVDASFRCLKSDDFVYVSDQGIINLKAKGGNQRIAWLNNTYMITQGSSYAASYITAYTIKLLQQSAENSAPITAENILAGFREKAVYVYPVSEKKDTTIVPCFFSIQKAAVFPCNKETTSILRFSNLLNFKLASTFDIKLSGNLGKKIKQFDVDGDFSHTVENIDNCTWDNFDTLILGHTHELEYVSKIAIRKTIIEKCLENRINIFSFDDELFDSELRAKFERHGLHIYYPLVSIDDIPQKMGRMYTIKAPVLGIFGTSKQQGKFTLQLQLRKRFIRDGYSIGQLGSEPESLLFGMDYVYPFGYRTTVDFDNLKSIEYLNYCMSQMDRHGYDILIAGSQSGTLPMLYNHLDHYPLDRISFLLGTNPDAVILCVNYHDKIADIKRTILGIEALARCKVIATSLFPLGYKNDWDIVRGEKSYIEDSTLNEFKGKITETLSIPCFILDEEKGPESLYQTAIDFFQKG